MVVVSKPVDVRPCWDPCHMTNSLPALAVLIVVVGLVLALGIAVGVVAAGRAARRSAPATPEWQLALAPVTASLGALADQVARQQHEATTGQASLRTELTTQLSQHVLSLQRSTDEVRREASRLTAVLGRTGARGRWGEMQLRRLVEAAGMLERVDFDEQSTHQGEDGSLRPDMVIRLAGDRSIVVDAKVPLAAFLEAEQATEQGAVEQHLRQHAADVIRHIDSLNGKDYRRHVPQNAEFVVMFLPSESLLEIALQMRPDLLDYAFSRDIVPATPTTMFALMRTVSLTWRQERLAENAAEISILGRELHSRISTLAQHFAKVGTALDSAVGHYNKAVASLETRVLVTARAFNEYGVSDDELPESNTITQQARVLTAREFICDPVTTKHLAS